MPVQDLTPQLRTRLSRVERSVGWFVLLATLILLAGFGYYIYHTAKEKGWFLTKVPYFTFVKDATGLNVGDPVYLMGFNVGEITTVEGTPAEDRWMAAHNYNVFVQFRIQEPYYGYVWTDSRVRIGTGDILGKRMLEVTKGSTGEVTVIPGEMLRILKTGTADDPDYVPLSEQPKGYWVPSVESPPLNERLDQIADQVQQALPGILQLTNQIAGVLTNSADLTGRASDIVQRAQPLLANLALISANLTNGNGSLGQWLIPTNINLQLHETLSAAKSALRTADTNMVDIAAGLTASLENLANLTSNLNAQVEANDQILAQLSAAIVEADHFVQGLRRHWLLRSAFKTNQPPDQRDRPPAAGPRKGNY